MKVTARNLGNVSVLALDGRIVHGETDMMRQAIRSRLAESHPQTNSLVLDFARVSAVDAGGLGLLLELRREAQARGIRLRVTNASRMVSRVFEITRLDSVFEVSPRVELSPITLGRGAQVIPLRACA